MPKNKIGGNKAKKGKNIIKESELYFKEDLEVYGIITEVLGNSRMKVFCDDSEIRICNIKGSMKKRIWMHKYDYVLVSLRKYNHDDISETADIVHKYNKEEVNKLYIYKELPEHMKTHETYVLNNSDPNDNIIFDDDYELEIDDDTINNI